MRALVALFAFLIIPFAAFAAEKDAPSGDVILTIRGLIENTNDGALVGTAGVMEHGAAIIHPRLGKPMRAAVGGGEALIPANAKVAAMGTSLDLPLGHKDNPWSFDYIDTITIQIADAPRADEILLCMAVSDGPRAHARVGAGPSAV